MIKTHATNLIEDLHDLEFVLQLCIINTENIIKDPILIKKLKLIRSTLDDTSKYLTSKCEIDIVK